MRAPERTTLQELTETVRQRDAEINLLVETWIRVTALDNRVRVLLDRYTDER